MCGSLSQLDLELWTFMRKMAREDALKSKRVVHADVRQATPAWTNTNRVNKANQFTPRPVQQSNIRPNLSTASKTIKTGRVNVNTGYGNVNSGSVHVNSGTQFKSGASRFNTGKQHVNLVVVHVNAGTQVKSGASRFNTGKQHINSGCVHINTARVNRPVSNKTSPKPFQDHPLKHMEHRGIFDSGCSGHMTGNRAHLEDYQELSKVGSVTFGGSKGSISGKGTIRLGNLVFDDVAFVKELGHFNLFSISQICDKKLNVLFTEKECYVVSSDFKMPDANQVLLKVPRQHNMYTFDMKNVDSSKGYTCLLAKASSDEAKLWHRRLGHLNFKNLNKLVKDNLVRGLPSKSFKNDHTCVACQKGKQHKASCKAKIDRYVTHPLHTLHMDLFGPTSVRSINHASYCLVITDDFSRSDNGTEFKNRVMLEFCGEKDIKQEFSNARTPQKNRVAERMNRTLIEELDYDSLTHTYYTFGQNSSNTALLFKEVIDFDVQSEEAARNSLLVSLLLENAAVLKTFATKKTHSSKKSSSTPNSSLLMYIMVLEKSLMHCLKHLGHYYWYIELSSSANIAEEALKWVYMKEVRMSGGVVTGIEAIRLFLAFASFMGFIVYQMDVKSAFLYGTIDEEVYVSQPPGFVDPDHPTKVYKVVKALYGLHQAPRAWYATLSTFLEKHGYKRGTIDKTLFIRRNKKDIMLVQVYVDDIIFGSTNKSWCDEFEALMQSRFQMSSMGELTFFLGLQVKQNKEGIFISQDKYVAEILKKFDLVNVKAAITPMETKLPLTKDEEAFDVDVHLYRSMIGSLMYLTASRPDIMYAVCVCSRFQVTPKTSHLNAVKRIFKYLKGKPNLGLWYPRESPLDLEAFSDSDYGGSNLDRKSTTGGCQFLGQRLISWQCKKQTIVATSTTEAEYVAAANCCGQVLWVQNQLLDYGFNFMNTKIHIDNESTICIVKNPVYHSKTKHIEIRHHFIRDCYEKKLISVEKIHTDLNVADLLTKPFDGPRFNYLVVSIDGHLLNILILVPPLNHEPENQAFRSSEENEQLRNLMDIVPRLQSRVESLEKELSDTKQTLGTAILQLTEKVKKLENKLRKKRKSKEAKDAEGQDQEVPFETDQGDTFATPEKSKGSGEAQEEQISPSTLEAAQILTNVASEGFKGSQAPLGSKIYKRKPKSTKTPTKILHFEEPDSAQVNTAQVNTAKLNPDSTPSAQVNTGEVNAAEVNTGEAERTSKELQELADLEEAKRVQAEMDVETQRQIDLDALLARRLVEQEEEAAREALATEFDYIQARLNADQILAEKIQQEEREQYSVEERAKFLHDTIAAQRKFLAEQRSAIIRNKPPTISQLRNQMITYLKHVANKKHAELKSKSFEEIQVLYERYKKQDQTFVAIGSEEDERAIKKMNEKDADKEEEKKDESVHEEVQEEEGAKKRKLGTRRKLKAKRRKHGSSLTREDDDLKICLHIAPDEDKVVDVESLNQQYPIIEWQSFFLTTKPQHDQTKPDEDIYLNKVTRSNGHQRFFRTLMGVLSILDREDLKVIYELVMEEYKDRLPEGFDRMLWGDLMIMFNQGDTADFWDTQQDWKLISWKLHSSSGVHTIMTSTGLVFHMLVESKYPLTKEVLSQMLELKLETEEESSMALELIKFVRHQLEEFEDSNDDDTVTSTHEDEERV
ncbi:putative ribonuclease H-like domain-containing protein [Tanacetum coccineum]|uniref:Ribonuclease H-like domain-containing protein n=1 Tax=Tanacetum coccineum TaxID=301880 RepID=A0ABQ5BKW5_9ASTR